MRLACFRERRFGEMRALLQGFIVAFSMYSKIPMPRVQWTEKNMKYCFCFFPLIGAVIGLAQNLWFHLAVYAGFGVNFRTAVLILIPVAVTGGIHLDGLLDTADALSSYKTMEEKLEILKDSHARSQSEGVSGYGGIPGSGVCGCGRAGSFRRIYYGDPGDIGFYLVSGYGIS